MHKSAGDSKLIAYSQIGSEMVAPIILGAVLDYSLGTAPWLSVAGAVLGFVGSMIHLYFIFTQDKNAESKKEQRGSKS